MSRKQIIINRFDGGISEDIRLQSANAFSISQHFDTFTFPNKLVPFRDSEADNTTQVGIMRFEWDGTTMYGLGLTLSGGLKAQIYSKTGLTGSWGTPATAVSTAISHMIGNTFIPYTVKTTSGIFTAGKTYLFHFASAAELNAWEIGGTYKNAYAGFTGSPRLYTDGSGDITQGLVHGKTDTLYIGYYETGSNSGGYIFSLNDVTATSPALRLPRNMIPTCLAEYGSYLAIGCRPAAGGNSKVFLWDMFKSDVSDVLDFGAGDLWVLGNVEGQLVGVMNGASNSDITYTNTNVYIKTYSGGTPTLFKVLRDTGLVLHGLTGYKPYLSTINGLTFGLYSTGSVVPTGLYTFSRANASYGFQVTCERQIFNSTSATSLVGIYKVGNTIFSAYNFVVDTSSNVGRTNDTALYTATSFIETQKYNFGDMSETEQLACVTVMCEPLPSGASYVVKYRVDSESNYTTIATNSTLNSTGKEHITIESTGKNFPIFKEIQLRIESTGGAVITGYKIVCDSIKTLAQLR